MNSTPDHGPSTHVASAEPAHNMELDNDAAQNDVTILVCTVSVSNEHGLLCCVMKLGECPA